MAHTTRRDAPMRHTQPNEASAVGYAGAHGWLQSVTADPTSRPWLLIIDNSDDVRSKNLDASMH